MLTCKNGCNRPVCCDDNLCLRCDGAAEKRARIVAMLRQWADDVSDAATKSTLLIAAHGIERGDT